MALLREVKRFENSAELVIGVKKGHPAFPKMGYTRLTKRGKNKRVTGKNL
jgi:uncharacterized short protein YbdD (DUF466 family)